VAIAKRHRHPKVRAIAAKVALEGEFRWRSGDMHERPVAIDIDRRSFAFELLSDRSIDVKYCSIIYLVESCKEQDQIGSIMLSQLLHPSAKLTDLARWWLGKHGVDWLAWLRQQLEDRPLDVVVARALGRFGERSDGERLWSSAGRAPERTRFVFVLSAARLKHEAALAETRAAALFGPDFEVSRSAAATLLKAGDVLSLEDLAVAAGGGPSFKSRGLFAHLRRQTIVGQLGLLARLEASGEPPDEQEFFRISQRINRGRFDPKPEHLVELRLLAGGAPKIRQWLHWLGLE
jgi:hypothetical protein